MISNTTRTPYHLYLLSISPIANRLEDVIGTAKFGEMLHNKTLANFIRTENLVTPAELWEFYCDIDNADNYFAECDMYDDEFDDEFIIDYPRNTDHCRKNKARRHRKALKNEKRGTYRSIPYARNGWGLYDKLEKKAQTSRAQAKDFKAQEKEYYLISIEPEMLYEPESICEPVTEAPNPTEQPVLKTPEELIGEAFKNGYHAGYNDGFEKGTEIARRDGYASGFEAGYAAAMHKVKEELAKFTTNL